MIDITSRWSILLLVAGTALALSVVSFGLNVRTVQVLNTGVHCSNAASAPVSNTSCNSEPSNTCKAGYLYHSDSTGSSFCRTENKLPGTPCTSSCFRPTTTGTHSCTTEGVCNTTVPLDCYGSCVSADGSMPDYGPIADCTNALNFTHFFRWDTNMSSWDEAQWLYYSDYPAECWMGRCVWYVLMTQIETAKPGYLAGSEYVQVFSGAIADPMVMLNQSNKEACISFKDIELDTNFSQSVLAFMFDDFQLPHFFGDVHWTERLHKMIARVYYYSCAPMHNESVLLNPDNLIGEYGGLGGSAAASHSHDTPNGRVRPPRPQPPSPIPPPVSGGFAKRSLHEKMITSRLDDMKQRIADHLTVQSGNKQKRAVLTDPRVSTLPSKRR